MPLRPSLGSHAPLTTRAGLLRAAALATIASAFALASALTPDLPRGAASTARTPDHAPRTPPATLAETGLYAPGSTEQLAPGVWPYAPQYPLWTDGATKARWIALPPGTAIDASDANAWRFPIGTRLWKEFAFQRKVETRYMELAADGRWLFATYVWSADGREARRAPAEGLRGAHLVRPAVAHDVPTRADCAACHEGRAVPVLGFSELQLSADRDPLAPHAERPARGAVDLPTLLARGLLVAPQRATVPPAPRVQARTARERAALGYLHANCGSCHTAGGPLGDFELELRLTEGAGGAGGTWGADPRRTLDTLLRRPSRFRVPSAGRTLDERVVPGEPQHSVLWRRVGSRNPLSQMPPLGTRLVDEEALTLLAAWIREDLGATPSAAPAPPAPPEVAAQRPAGAPLALSPVLSPPSHPKE